MRTIKTSHTRHFRGGKTEVRRGCSRFYLLFPMSHETTMAASAQMSEKARGQGTSCHSQRYKLSLPLGAQFPPRPAAISALFRTKVQRLADQLQKAAMKPAQIPSCRHMRTLVTVQQPTATTHKPKGSGLVGGGAACEASRPICKHRIS